MGRKKESRGHFSFKEKKNLLFFFPILNWRSFLLHVLAVDEGGHDCDGSYKIRVGMMVAMMVKWWCWDGSDYWGGGEDGGGCKNDVNKIVMVEVIR